MRPLGFAFAIAALLSLTPSCGSDDADGGSGASSSAGGASVDAAAADLCVKTINELRAQEGLPPLSRWTVAEGCADGEAKSDAETNTPHGAFARCGESGQNECPGWGGGTETAIVQCLRTMWAQGKGEGHHDLMASTKATRVACGFHTTASGAMWSVQDFQ